MSTFLKHSPTHIRQIFVPLLLITTLAACSDNDNDDMTPDPVPVPLPVPVPEPVELSYEITITNLTHAQPLSPITAVAHADAKLWSIGEAASVALEQLAESGSNVEFIAQAPVVASIASDGVVMPGTSSTITLTTSDETATHLTLSTMLVNTNDAFTGLTGLELSNLTVDTAMTWHLNVYDAGTEGNTESAGTIPGPADGGEGFNEARDDTNVVSYHSGVVSQDDGLTSSVLTQAHRFDNPAIMLTITRTK